MAHIGTFIAIALLAAAAPPSCPGGCAGWVQHG
ncbi:uncharacterized protein LOC27207488 [Drosophila simulans]|uniref:Uncharacterized protein n=2 Tax=melanogaster subgroup TaxID=32351 RepID=A0A0J9RWY3_DROSI|nr:uncharacterized protein LOC27207488 [Drosophila simulans]XP_033160131.1 uncharacterized protein LOC117140989 [Drosophila mauritiana]KMZ00103.1 uncharacterized protein Dsimw501_GD27639 [Drosophila simulans]